MAAAIQTPSLSREAIDLIKAGTPKPQTQAPILAAISPEMPPEAAAPKPTSEPAQPTKPKAQKEKVPQAVNLVFMSFRVPAEIPQALLKASLDRKLNKIRPSTQQEIIAEALSDWIKKNGYLN